MSNGYYSFMIYSCFLFSQERNKKSLPSRLRNNRLSLQTCSMSPPSSPPIENGRPSSTNNAHQPNISPISSPHHDDNNGCVLSGGLSPTSLHEIQTELKAVLSSLEQFTLPDSSTKTKPISELTCSLPTSVSSNHQRAGSEPHTIIQSSSIINNRPPSSSPSHAISTKWTTADSFIHKM